MLLSPAYVQVFGGREDAVRAWRMFHRRGVGICSALYYDHDRRIDRYALFELERATAPDDFRRIVHEAQARLMAQRICAKLEQAGTHAPEVARHAALRRDGGAANSARSRGQPMRQLSAWLDRALETERATRAAAL
jgi:hypothetical protein